MTVTLLTELESWDNEMVTAQIRSLEEQTGEGKAVRDFFHKIAVPPHPLLSSECSSNLMSHTPAAVNPSTDVESKCFSYSHSQCSCKQITSAVLASDYR